MAKLRVTCLQLSRRLLWIGSSAGVVLTMPLPNVGADGKWGGVNGGNSMPKLSTSFHGHTGLVRFVTTIRLHQEVVEVNGRGKRERELGSQSSPRHHHRSFSDTSTIDEEEEYSTPVAEPAAAAVACAEIVVSGGDGFEDFRTSGDAEVDGRDDSTSHILTWHT